MVEIYPNLFIGSEQDYEGKIKGKEGWWVVHACKEPYHRQALGYRTRGAPKDHPEYLVARRGHRLILNLVDASNPAYIPKEIIDAALEFIDQGIREGKQVLVHCNQGESRSPSIGLLYLAAFTDVIPSASLCEAEEAFLQIYPYYRPGKGMRGFLVQHWETYCAAKDDNDA